ncbi:hypothetical protein [Cellulomonas fengjieae]|uniref:Secreted protein n=1 Tax=Cellulomonas fengjieae TaxID=2819978 RepID=A0ABS3SJW6_9CELL|nr:hypothetical protein [Cellulomonas fengjieae]MBO3085251.1 hypothetical protein [Cellulomonas fengjieae]QVI66185.1 hypothetical protein KG102_00690 [Cellulomonas fengjieae]
MTHGEKTAIVAGALAMVIGLVTGLTPAASIGALVMLIGALTVVLRLAFAMVARHRGITPEG